MQIPFLNLIFRHLRNRLIQIVPLSYSMHIFHKSTPHFTPQKILSIMKYCKKLFTKTGDTLADDQPLEII